jgi:glucose/mannose transport system substrate-binding protein
MQALNIGVKLGSRVSRLALAAALSVVAGAGVQAEPKTNLLHQWATGGDALAIAKLGEMFEAEGGSWEQTPIPGHTANTLSKLRAEVLAGNAPPAVQLKGPEIAEWAATGYTADLNELASKEDWDEVVAPTLIGVMKPDDAWVAAPMNIHRINWMWASKPALDQVGVTELPGTWDEFNEIAQKLADAGITPVAHGSMDWTDGTLFEIVVYGMDPELYRQAFVDLDLDALQGEGMAQSFAQLRKMVEWMDEGIPGRTWDVAAAMMLRGEAGFHFMGDWAIGYYNNNGFTPNEDYLCGRAPMNVDEPGFILNSDSVVFFKVDDPDYQEGQELLAHLIMSPEFQKVFNVAKGSIPARMDVDLSEDFNPCQQLAQADLQETIAADNLVVSMAHNMAVPQKFRAAMLEVITEFVNDPSLSPEDAAVQLADAVANEL